MACACNKIYYRLPWVLANASSRTIQTWTKVGSQLLNTYKYLRVCVSAYVCVCLSVGAYMYVCVYIYIYTRTRIGIVSKVVSRAKWRMLKKCSHEVWFARRSDARLPYPTQTGGHRVCITRKDDPALRLLKNRCRQNHLFASLAFPTESHLALW